MRPMQMFASLLLLACVSGATVAPTWLLPACADVEPNSTKPRAETIAPGSVTGRVNSDDPRDFYRFRIAGGDIVRVTMEQSWSREVVEIWLLDHEGSGLEDLSLEDQTEVVWLTPVELGEQDWFVKVAGQGSYRFILDITHQNDGGQGQDAPRDYEHGLPVVPGDIEGMLGNDDEADAYRFSMTAGQTIEVQFQADFGRYDEDLFSLELVLRDPEGSRIEDIESAGQVATMSFGPLAEEEAGEYKLIAWGEGDYRVGLQITGGENLAPAPLEPLDLQPAEGSVLMPELGPIVGPSEAGRVAGAEKKELAERYIIRERFFTSLLERSQEQTARFHGVKPSRQSWLATGASRTGLSYKYIIRQHDTRIELYIDRGKDSEEENKAVFDQLFAHKDEIEAALGSPIEWLRLDDRRASVIKSWLETGGYRDDEEQWPAIQDAMIGNMIRFEAAFRNHIARLRT